MNIKVGDIIYLVGLNDFGIFQIREIYGAFSTSAFCFIVDQIVGDYSINNIMLYEDEITIACKTLFEQWTNKFIIFNEEVFLNYIRTHDIT
jgi:hypothetical protein